MSAEFDIVRHPRARTMRLSVDPASGRVRLTLPRRAALGPALAWAEEKRAWIERQRARLPEAQPFAPGAEIPFGDGTLSIDWVTDRSRVVRRDDDRLICGGPREGLSRRVTNWLKREALTVLSAETAECAERAGVTVAKVAIGDPKARWGSCSSSGMIRYSWRLILAPAFVRRSTVAHEVAHRVHMHHGPQFHAFAAALSGPDGIKLDRAAHAWFGRNGSALHWIGRDG